ncbi:hypothetical protein [Cognatiyoonia sp. IB215182]|uniref:hypothetical protein n=1 Tax=Cognatiyoonia sp. IB215182 TaxID=3097353 RepID=UPI002A159DDB|nr:hypothetical protein [Cognatiyoonia sp. IB215182]MDX8351600.1 hypothetical protein [Cognatiyoonia sp. IB215182]
MDPYSYVAGRLPTDQRKAIRAFWSHFEANADALDQYFSSKMTEITTDPSEVMAALGSVSPELMWEFGPSDRGHALTVTAEWHDDNRPLARAVHDMAPDLPRWRFHEVRSGESDSRVTADYFAARFGKPLALTHIDTALGRDGRIDLTARGQGNAKTLADQALQAASIVLGEEVDRDWLGFIDGAPTAKAGIFGRLRQQPAEPFDAAGFAERFRATIADAKSQMPQQPYSAVPPDNREAILFKANKIHSDHRRCDLMTFTTSSETYGHAVLSGGRFSSRCHSLHDEWFLYLRIPRTSDTPFDDVSERGAIEDRLHDALSADGLGGMVAAGHGQEAVYIDLAVTDVALAVERVAQTLGGEIYADAATLHFLDQGLQRLIIPAAPDLLTLN